MSIVDYQLHLSTGIKAALLAAKITQNVQQKLTDEFHQKKDKSPVTIADYASQAVICKTLHDQFPEVPIIGEEDSHELRQPEQAQLCSQAVAEIQAIGWDVSEEELCTWIDYGGANSYAPLFWTLDPIDGTKGFLRKDQYAISLALIENGKIKVGILVCPNLNGGQVLSAIEGSGAYLSSLKDPHTRQKISVSTVEHFANARLCESFESGHSAHDETAVLKEKLGIEAEPVRMDSQAKYAMVAQGLAEIYLRMPTRKDYREKIWDHAGGVLVVEEAGGQVTDISGKPLDFSQGHELSNNEGVLVTNKALHHRLEQALAKDV